MTRGGRCSQEALVNRTENAHAHRRVPKSREIRGSADLSWNCFSTGALDLRLSPVNLPIPLVGCRDRGQTNSAWHAYAPIPTGSPPAHARSRSIFLSRSRRLV